MKTAADYDIRYIVLLAGTGLRGDKNLLAQQEARAAACGASGVAPMESVHLNRKFFDEVISDAGAGNLNRILFALVDSCYNRNALHEHPAGLSCKRFTDLQIGHLTAPCIHSFLLYDRAEALKKCPMLDVNGGKDMQLNPRDNLLAIEKALKTGKNKMASTRTYPVCNHGFQKCQTEPEEPFSVLLLQEVQKKITKKL